MAIIYFFTSEIKIINFDLKKWQSFIAVYHNMAIYFAESLSVTAPYPVP